jgi:hypothetical protein
MVKKKKEEQRIKKPFILAGVSLIVIVLLGIVSIILGEIGSILLSSAISALVLMGILLTFVGFYYLGNRYKNEFLKRTIIAGFILFVILGMLASNVPESYEQRISSLNNTISVREANFNQLVLENSSEEVLISFEKETEYYLIKEGIPLVLPILIAFLAIAIYSTFFGIGMIKLKEVKRAKLIGILSIVSVWLFPTIIGIFLALPIMMASYVLTIIMFFEEAKKTKEI